MNFNNLLIRYFGLGNIHFAPGSFASLFILILWYYVPNNFYLQFFILLLHLIIGFCSCYLYYSHDNIDNDPSFIVIDEVVGMIVCLFLIPKIIGAYIIAFILFRFFDIFKPSIIYRSQKLTYGIGIMADDLIAGFITFLIVSGLYF